MKLKDVKRITSDIITKAVDYMPLADKTAFAEYVSTHCLERLELRAETDEGKTVTVPPIYKENAGLKRRYELGVFVRFYLGFDADMVDDDPYLLTEEDYDTMSRMHIFNQIERLKQQDTRVKDKIWDLMQDFRDLEKCLNCEIYGITAAQNDLLVRGANLVANQLSAATLEMAKQELESAKSEVLDYVANKA